jgi:hypothetical protein
MKVLQNIKSELIVAVDIETVRVEENYEDLSDGFKSAWQYKNKQDGKVPSEEELSDLWNRTSSLYAEFSKICAISLAYLDPQGKLVCKEYYGADEKSLLQAVAVTLGNMQAHNSQYRLVGHASKYFDYPFTSKRYIINELDIPSCLDTTALKPWEGSNLCTNDLWKCGGTGAGSSLQALCNVLGVPISKVDLVGDEVGTAFYKEECPRIGRYCSYDSVATFNVFRKFKKEPIFQFDEVTYIVAYSDEIIIGVEDEEKVPLLKKLHASKQFNDEVKKELKALKIAKKDIPTVKKLVLAHYKERIDVMAQNKKELQEINNQREIEITEFFKNYGK